MGQTISTADLVFIEQMKKADILGNHIPERLHVEDGVILVCCSDGDQFDKVMDHMRDAAIATGAKPRIHTFANHGGALLVSPDFHLFCKHGNISDFLLTQLAQAKAMKEINTIVLSVHAPCGAAAMSQMNVVQLINHMMRAKNLVKERLHGVKVLCVLFVDYGSGNKQSYTIARKDWDRFIQSQDL